MSSKTPDKLFEKSAFGYRPEDVDRYVEQQSAQIRTLEAEKADLLEKMKILAEKVSEYRKEEGALRDALLGAQKMGNTIIADAKTKADMMITDAKSRSERMIYDAQKTAEETLGGIRTQVDREKMTLAKMEKAVADFKSKLLSIYKVHLNAITSLPDMEDEYEEIYNSRTAAPKEESAVPPEQPQEPPQEPEAPAEAVEEPLPQEEESQEEVLEIQEPAEPAAEEVSTVRFDRVEKAAPPAPRPCSRPPKRYKRKAPQEAYRAPFCFTETLKRKGARWPSWGAFGLSRPRTRSVRPSRWR